MYARRALACVEELFLRGLTATIIISELIDQGHKPRHFIVIGDHGLKLDGGGLCFQHSDTVMGIKA